MKPILLSIGEHHPFHLYSYGLFVALGCVTAIAMVAAGARREGLDRGQMVSMLLLVAVAGFVGSRVLFVLLDAPAFARVCIHGRAPGRSFAGLLGDCSQPLQFWRGGTVWYGGLVAGTLAGVVFASRQRWPLWRLADLFAPAIAVGHAIGRIGCFAAGCCFGKPTALSVGVRFPPASPAAHQYTHALGGWSLPLHPTQLYEVAGLTAIATGLLWLRRRARRNPGASRPGTVALAFLFAYSGLRFLVEIFRGDIGRHYIVTWRTDALSALLRTPMREPILLSTSQLVSAIMALAAAALVVLRARTSSARREREETTLSPADSHAA